MVTYRAGDIILPATGNLAADSGKSIFLEESYKQKGSIKTFRWEIPYPCIVEMNECPEIPKPSASVKRSPGNFLRDPCAACLESARSNSRTASA